jgi:flavin reductase (DIM6/NTAB) family NADH-FMN oxidoreductase RutF
MQKLPLSKVYQHIEPGPVVLLATRAKSGQPNVMTMSWNMMVEFEPPLIACIVSSANHSFKALTSTKECVIAIPSVELAELVVKLGNCSGRDVDKFATFGVRTSPAKTVAPPIIADCYANLECRVVETRLANKLNLFVLEAVAAWQQRTKQRPRTIHHRGYGEFAVDGEIIKLASKMR